MKILYDRSMLKTRFRALAESDSLPASALSTPERILAAAERLFAERSIDAVSLREITGAAGANIAAAHYHFGSKDAVLDQLFARHARPISDQRLALLGDVKRDRRGRPVLEEVLRAFLRPALEISSASGGRTFTLLRARIGFEPADLRQRLLRSFDESTKKTLELLGEALPSLPKEQLYWRFHFLLGAMVYTMASPGRIEAVTNDAIDTTNSAAALEELVRFAVAAFKGA